MRCHGETQGDMPILLRLSHLTPEVSRRRGHLGQGQDQVGGSEGGTSAPGDTWQDVRTPEGGHVARDTDTWEGHFTGGAEGYKYQFLARKGISPEPILYKCNTKPIPVNFAKIVHTSWISVYDLLL